MATQTRRRVRQHLKPKSYPDGPMEGWKEGTTPSAETLRIVKATEDKLRAECAARGIFPVPDTHEGDERSLDTPEGASLDRHTEAATNGREVNGETVKVLLENSRELAHGEESRGVSLKQRAGVLLGFEGAIFAVAMTQAGRVISQDLGSVGVPLAAMALITAAVLLLVGAVYALRVLGVAQVWHMDGDEARRHGTYEYVTRQPTDMRGELLLGWTRQFAEEREANNPKAEQLQRAFTFLGASIIPLGIVFILTCLPAFSS